MTILVGIILAGFLSLILISKKGKSLSDKILLAWLMVVFVTLILYKLQAKEYRDDFPFFLGMGFPFPLAQWPFLYLYVLSLTSREPLRLNHLLHFTPFLLSFLLFSSYFILPCDEKLLIYNKEGKGFETELAINLGAIMLSAIIYTVLSSLQLWKYQINIKNEYSYSEKITLNWLFYLTIGMTGLLLIILLGANDQIIFSGVTAIVFFIGFFGIKQVGIFNQKIPAETALDVMGNFSTSSEVIAKPQLQFSENANDPVSATSGEVQKGKYEKSKLDEETKNSIHQRLTEVMKIEQLYKNPQLTLSEVAEKIPVHPNILSQIINSIEGKNFYDYINFQRIEEFQRIVVLPQNQKFTLLSLAYECGFNSKTSFNRNFKKATNLSPTDYLSQINIQLQE